MSKQDPMRLAPLKISITPAPGGASRYMARIDGDDRVLCVSRAPFFDGARELIANGYDPEVTLVMRHAGSETDSLRAKLGMAASLTVEETDYGPKLRRWKPISTLAVRPRIAPTGRRAPSSPPSLRCSARSAEGGGKKTADWGNLRRAPG